MKLLPAALILAAEPGAQDPAAVLDAWHIAAAQCDAARYFGLMTEDAVFLGTDPGERWDREAFRAWAAPYFQGGKAWTFKATRRSLRMAKDGQVAWFDEDLDTPNLGPARGSGVLLRTPKGWRIVQYNLSVPIPNGAFKDVKQLIERSAGKR